LFCGETPSDFAEVRRLALQHADWDAAFMHNWPCAYTLGNGDDSKVKGLFGVITLPVGAEGDTSAVTLGGGNAAVSKYSKLQEAAVAPTAWLAGPVVQKMRALRASNLNTVWNTVRFSVLSVPFENALGMAVALMLNASFKGRGRWARRPICMATSTRSSWRASSARPR